MATFIYPVIGVISSPFGMRNGTLHAGVDFAAAPGTPVRAAASGKVVRANVFGGYGNAVDIDHGNGYMTRYGHLLRIGTKLGSVVTQGSIIGYVGSTGDSTGPHLHFEIRNGNSPTDPMPYLKGSTTVGGGGFDLPDPAGTVKDASMQFAEIITWLRTSSNQARIIYFGLGIVLLVMAVNSMVGKEITTVVLKATGTTSKNTLKGVTNG